MEGEDYRFVSTSEFDAMVERGEFIEWATIGGHRYGTTVASVQALAAEGKVCVLDVDVQGVEARAAGLGRRTGSAARGLSKQSRSRRRSPLAPTCGHIACGSRRLRLARCESV